MTLESRITPRTLELVERVAAILGGRGVLHRQIKSWKDLEQLVAAGLPKRSLQLFARRSVGSGESVSDFVYSVVPPATFKRRHRLSCDESERTERIARVIAFADSIWEDEDEARAFLNKPHPLLDGLAPLQVARTELGARRVERLLQDVEHGLAL